MRPFRRRSGPMLTPLARLCLGAALIAGLALSVALSSLDANPDGEGDLLPPQPNGAADVAKLNPVAVTSADLLRAIDEGGWVTRTELFESIGRDPKNSARDLGVVEKAGLIRIDPDKASPRPITLTEEGQAQLAAIGRAEHGGQARRPRDRCLVANIIPNPANRRVEDAAVAALADTIEAVGDVLESVQLTPADANGVRMLLDGEHRWRAVQLLTEQGRLPEALEKGLRFEEREATEAEQILIRIVTATARADLSPLDDARQLLALQKATNWSAREIAKKTGRSPADSDTGVRDVQVKIRIAKDATAEALAAYEADGSWDRLRESVTEKKPPADPAPETAPIGRIDHPDTWAADRLYRIRQACENFDDRHRLVLLEIADRCIRFPSPDHPERDGLYTQCGPHWPDPTRTSTMLVGEVGAGFGSGGGKPDYVCISDVARDWMVENGWLIPGRGAKATVLHAMRRDVAGEKIADRLIEGGYWTPWLNLPADDAATLDTTAPAASEPDPTHRPWTEVEVLEAPIREAFTNQPVIVIRLYQGTPDAGGQDGPWAYGREAQVGATRHAHEMDLTRDPDATFGTRAAALAAAIRTIRREYYDDLPRAYAEWMDGLQGPHFVNGIDRLNASNAGEARRALGWEKRHSNSGGSADLSPLDDARAERMDAAARDGTGLVLAAAIADLTEAIDGHLAGIRRDLVKGGQDLAQFEEDTESLREAAARAGDVLEALGLGEGEGLAPSEDRAKPPALGEPFVPVRKSITPEHVTCLYDGRRFAGGLRRHLLTRYNETPDEYRRKWNLPADYPMIAPNHAKRQHDALRAAALRVQP